MQIVAKLYQVSRKKENLLVKQLAIATFFNIFRNITYTFLRNTLLNNFYFKLTYLYTFKDHN